MTTFCNEHRASTTAKCPSGHLACAPPFIIVQYSDLHIYYFFDCSTVYIKNGKLHPIYKTLIMGIVNALVLLLQIRHGVHATIIYFWNLFLDGFLLQIRLYNGYGYNKIIKDL